MVHLVISRNCKYCEQSFETRNSDINRGFGKFCSIKCGLKFRYKSNQIPNTTCAYCDKLFYRPSSHKKGRSKSGLYFCCRTHKDLAQRIGGLSVIQPRHYGSGYKSWARRELGNACVRCGYTEFPILEIHHIDRDRTNNKIENLELLCPNCHSIEHLTAG